MRPIKFRAWDPSRCIFISPIFYEGRWYEDGRAFEDGRYWINICAEQFTGLHDKNGREIYDGDILQSSHGMILPVHAEDFHAFRFMWGKDQLYRALAMGGEVIGNIHENPELLK